MSARETGAAARDAAVEAVDEYSTQVWRALGHADDDDDADSFQVLRAVEGMSAEVERFRAAINDATTSLDGEHLATCMRTASRYAHCDCIIGRVRYALTKAVSL